MELSVSLHQKKILQATRLIRMDIITLLSIMMEVMAGILLFNWINKKDIHSSLTLIRLMVMWLYLLSQIEHQMGIRLMAR